MLGINSMGYAQVQSFEVPVLEFETRKAGHSSSRCHGILRSHALFGMHALLEGSWEAISGGLGGPVWGIVKIMVPFWVPIMIRGLILGPKRNHNFDNPHVARRTHGPSSGLCPKNSIQQCTQCPEH